MECLIDGAVGAVADAQNLLKEVAIVITVMKDQNITFIKNTLYNQIFHPTQM
jgi:hypothetical protein